MAIMVNSCQDSTGPDDSKDNLYLIKVNNLIIPDTILDSEPFTISFSAYVGENSCYSLFDIDTIRNANNIKIYVWGKYDSTLSCTLPQPIIEWKELTFYPPFNNNTMIINFYQPHDSLIVDTINVLHLSQDPDWINYTTYNSLIKSDGIYALATDLDDNLWVGTWDYATGIFRFDGTSVMDFSDRRYELEHYFVESITVDNFGNIWVGSFTSPTISKYDGSDWQVFDINSEIDRDDVHSLVFDLDGNLWIGTHHTHLYKFDGNDFTELDTVNSLNYSYIEALAVDSNNNLWIGFLNGGVGKYNGNDILLFSIDELGLGWYNYINDMQIDSQDRVYIATSGKGLLVFSNGIWTKYDMSNSNIPSNYLNALAIDSQDNVWLASSAGLIKYDRNVWTLYNHENSGLIDNTITCLTIDSNDQIWIGTYEFGITLFKNGN